MNDIKTWQERMPRGSVKRDEKASGAIEIAMCDEIVELRAALEVERAALADAVRHVGNLKEQAARATPAQPVPLNELPPLPEAKLYDTPAGPMPRYTAHQMREYALATAVIQRGVGYAEGVKAASQQDAVGKFVIDVEKALCAKLGKTWSATGMSIESLIDELATSQQVAEPVAWARQHPDGRLAGGEILWDGHIEPVRKTSGAWVPLYRAAPLQQDESGLPG
jgi:hypothetical protein